MPRPRRPPRSPSVPRGATSAPLTSRQNERMIEGFEIGHHTADGDGWLTGCTVVLALDGAVGGVDVRGGGPGTRETDLLNPTANVSVVHAVALCGGSAFGLSAATGVVDWLAEHDIGYPTRVRKVPI